MAVINLGRVGYVHKGAYAAATTYQKYDVVLYNHGSYLYIGDTASSGHAPTDTTYWQAMLDPNEMNAATEAAVNAAEAAHASALELAGQVDRLTTPFSITGDVVNCHPVSDYPLGVISHIEPVQSGSGDPSPSNVRPISGWTGAMLNMAKKNLLPDLVSGYWDAITGEAVDSYAWVRTPYLIPCFPGYTFTFSKSDGTEPTSFGNFVLYDAEKKVTRYFGSPFTITIAENERYLALYMGTGMYESEKPFQLALSPVSTAYEPYQGKHYNVQFGQTVYGGELDWKTGVLTARYAVLTLDESTCTFRESGVVQTAAELLTDYMHTSGGMSSHYAFGPYRDDYPDNYVYPANDTTFIVRDHANFATSESALAYIAAQRSAGTPIQIYYELKEPVQIQLTPQQILSLAGENNLWSDCGETTVNGPNSPKVMENRIAALEAAIANMA